MSEDPSIKCCLSQKPSYGAQPRKKTTFVVYAIRPLLTFCFTCFPQPRNRNRQNPICHTFTKNRRAVLLSFQQLRGKGGLKVRYKTSDVHCKSALHVVVAFVRFCCEEASQKTGEESGKVMKFDID